MATKPSLLLLITTTLFLVLTLAHAIPTVPNHDHDHNHVNVDGNSIARRSVSIDLTRNPDYVPNGPAAYARALKKWGAEVPSELVNSLAVMKGNVGEVGAASVRGDREYLSRVGYGTPPQYLDVDLDTGSSDVWVYTSETRKSITADRPVWVIENSTTAKKVDNATWIITYGDGSRAWGNIYTDHIDLGGITVHNAVIESAISASPSLTSDRDIDGIFGLAYSLPSQTDPQQRSVLTSLAPNLTSPLFTVDLRYHSSAGAYTFGHIDPSRHLPNTSIHYTPLIPNATFWQFNYTGLHVGGQNLWYLSQQWSAIADTGTTLLLLGQDAVDLYYNSGVAKAEKNSSMGGIWTYPCGGETLPDFELGFANGFIATVPGRFMNYSVMPDDPRMCMGGLQAFGLEDFGILGDIFLKAVYAVFDVGGGRIGFANKPLHIE